MKSVISVCFVKSHPDAVLPKRNHNDTYDYTSNGDTGYDLTCIMDTIILAGESAVVPIGLKLGYVSNGYWCRIESRSGKAFKNGLVAFNGIIDNQYRGDLSVLIFNHSKVDYTFKMGERAAQLVFYPIVPISASFIDKPLESKRGEKGFGSSDEIDVSDGPPNVILPM